MSRIVFYVASSILLFLTVFLAGMYSGFYRTTPYRIVAGIKEDIDNVRGEIWNLTGTRPTNWLVDKRYPGGGVTRNAFGATASEFVMLQGFFDDGLEIRLIQRDGEIVARWPVSYSALADDIEHVRNPPETDWNVGFDGAVLLSDGSVVFNLSHVGLYRLDRCGAPIWSVPRPTHHSVELNADGSFWTASSFGIESAADAALELFRPPYAADSLLHVSSTGEVLDEISLLDVFVESEQLGLLTLTGNIVPSTVSGDRPDFARELFHLNDVEELPLAFADAYPMFSAGDLLVSLRNRNLILVIDGETHTIKWWHVGPWVRHHDPDWNPDGSISLFDNNRDGTGTGEVLGSSRILALDPATEETRVLFGGAGEKFFYTERRGKHQVLADARLLILESEGGRVFEIDRAGHITWEYVNAFGDAEDAILTDARVYESGYFDIDSWTCSAQ